MQIKSEKYNSSQLQITIFEHFMLTFLTWIISFIGLFYFSLNLEDKIIISDFSLLVFLLKNPVAWSIICSLVTILANIILAIKTFKKTSTRAFLFDDENKKLSVIYKKRYSKKSFKQVFSYSIINYIFGKKKTWQSSKEYHYINLMCKKQIVGEIFMADLIWNDDIKSYKAIKRKTYLNYKTKQK